MLETTSQVTSKAAPQEDRYTEFTAYLQERLNAVLAQGEMLLFTTNATGLFDAYLQAMPPEHRQFYTCSCCRHFVEHFGSLVTIDQSGITTPALWAEDAPGIHREGVAAMARIVRRAKIKGQFLSSEREWGHAEHGGWPHMHVTPPEAIRFHRTVLTAGQKMAEKREDFGIVGRALEEFTVDHIETALKLLRSDSLYSAEKVIGPAEFLSKLHTDRASAKGEARNNILWRAVAAAPAGFCHPRSSMVGTLLEDIAAGMNFDTVKSRFEAKMHPLRYQRPQAAPAAGNIAQAEKLFEQLGLAPALERRIARLDEVPKVWEPRQKEPEKQATGGVFGHLQPKGAAPARSAIEIPAITMTLQKFVQTVATTAEQIEVRIQHSGNPFIAITTAVNEDAPRLFQWDHPFAWYLWNGGAPASQYGLQPGWAKVSGITRLPARWDDDGQRFIHHGDGLVLLLEGATETREAGAALFPSLMRSELHGVRATIEAHSLSARMQGISDGTAIGYDMRQGGGCQASLRVTTNGSTQEYKIDRWD